MPAARFRYSWESFLMANVVVVCHSGYEHTAKDAQAVARSNPTAPAGIK
jgi:hypothetical protein